MRTFHTFQFTLEPADLITVGLATRSLHFSTQLVVLLDDDLDTALAQAHDLFRCASDLVDHLEQRKRDAASRVDVEVARAVNEANRASDAVPFGSAVCAPTKRYVVRIPLTGGRLECCSHCFEPCGVEHSEPVPALRGRVSGGCRVKPPYMQSAYSGLVPVPETHTRASTDVGPDYCAECSEAAQAWVKWPCEWAVRRLPTLDPKPYQSVEVTLPQEVLDDLEAFLWERNWTLRQRPMNEHEWYAVPVEKDSQQPSEPSS